MNPSEVHLPSESLRRLHSPNVFVWPSVERRCRGFRALYRRSTVHRRTAQTSRSWTHGNLEQRHQRLRRIHLRWSEAGLLVHAVSGCNAGLLAGRRRRAIFSALCEMTGALGSASSHWTRYGRGSGAGTQGCTPHPVTIVSTDMEMPDSNPGRRSAPGPGIDAPGIARSRLKPTH